MKAPLANPNFWIDLTVANDALREAIALMPREHLAECDWFFWQRIEERKCNCGLGERISWLRGQGAELPKEGTK